MNTYVALPKLDVNGKDVEQRLQDLGLVVVAVIDNDLYSVEIPSGWGMSWRTDWPQERGTIRDYSSNEDVAVWVKEYESYGRVLVTQYTEFLETSSD
jgi:hypothetical protein